MLDYQTQQFKLLPLLASTYALSFIGQYMLRLYAEMTGEIAEGKLDSLPEVSITTIYDILYLVIIASCN